MTATLLDGTTCVVQVQRLRVKDFPRYLAAMPDECRQVEVLCGQEPGWAESLTIESHEAILAEGEKLNADFFSRWLERRKAREAKLPKADMGEVVQMIEALSKSNPGLLDDLSRKALGASRSSSPTLPPAAG